MKAKHEYYKDSAGHKSAFKLTYNKDWKGSSILFCGFVYPLSSHAIINVKFDNLPRFISESEYKGIWGNIKSFSHEITEDEFKEISSDKVASITGGLEIER